MPRTWQQVLDLWIHDWRQRHATNEVMVVRYADDFVIGFREEADARKCLAALQGREKVAGKRKGGWNRFRFFGWNRFRFYLWISWVLVGKQPERPDTKSVTVVGLQPAGIC